METKLYIRDGRRFKYVPNMIGMYWNGIILTKEKIQDNIAMVDSIAVVIEQHYDHVTMASLKTSSRINWFDAKEWCLHAFNDVYQGRLPSKTELIMLHKYVDNSVIWGEENSEVYAWTLGCLSGGLNGYPKSYSRYARAIAVIDIPILNLI